MSSKIAEVLDIFLITYNRAQKLEKTLQQILAPNSPIKDFEIKIIDNNSTDNTAEIIKNYRINFPNLKYSKNKYNVGGNANITRAFEQAEKEYIWILCDDDDYNWESWDDVVEGINDKEDCIIVGHCDNPKYNLIQTFAQTTFLPSGIYKTSNIDDQVLSNMYYNISNMFPHLALSAKLINENKSFKISNTPIVLFGGDDTMSIEKTYIRGNKKTEVHPFAASNSYIAGYANALMLIKDKKLRHKFIQNRKFYATKATSINFFIENSVRYSRSLYNMFCVFNVLSFWQKIHFIFNWILYNIFFRFIYIYTYENYVDRTNTTQYICRLRLFKNLLKTNLYKIKIKNKET